jgi:hypothetical protein
MVCVVDQWKCDVLVSNWEKDDDKIYHYNVVVSYSWFVIGQCCNFHGINSTVEISWDIFRILADFFASWDSISNDHSCDNWLKLGVNCIAFENFKASVGDLMVANWVHWRRVSGSSKRIFETIKSTILADYRLHYLVNNATIHIYTQDYIRMETTVLYLKISRHQLSI